MSGPRTALGVGVVLTAALAGAPALRAQEALPWAGATGIAFELYRFSEPDGVGMESLSLVSIPFGARVPLFGRINLEASGAYARGSLVSADGAEIAISGLTDTELRLRFPFANGRAVAHGVAVLPTGHATHSAAESVVAGAIAADLLPFRITHWGSGGGAGLGLTMTRSFGGYGLGFSGSYLVSREFEPLEANRVAYRPGNTLMISVAADRNFGATGKATLQFAAQHHATDAFDDTNLFRAGKRYHLTGTYAFAAGARSTGIVYAGALHRQRGAALANLTVDAPAQDLIIAGGGLRVPAGRGVLQPRADLRVFRSNDGVGQGYVVGLGAAAEWPAGAAVLIPALRARLGNVIVRDGLESGLTGVELSLGVRLGGGAR